MEEKDYHKLVCFGRRRKNQLKCLLHSNRNKRSLNNCLMFASLLCLLFNKKKVLGHEVHKKFDKKNYSFLLVEYYA